MKDRESIIGRTIAGKFFIESRVGSGAMGVVYQARQISLDKRVAVKVLHFDRAQDPNIVARFRREARAASKLNHPNSVQVIDYGVEPDELCYIAMEFLDGVSLQKIIRREGRLSARRAIDVTMQVLGALAVAHDMGIVHRDLKPDNIVVTRAVNDDGKVSDVIKVCDFGIAKMQEPRSYNDGRGGSRGSVGPVTHTGFLVGTPEYMSPEQGRGEHLDSRSDLYSVGVILYQMIAGIVPFQAENAIGIVLQHITQPPPPPSTINPNVDPRLEELCLRALDKNPANRFANAREMRTALKQILEQLEPGVRVSGPPLAEPFLLTERAAPSERSPRSERASSGSGKLTLAGTEAQIVTAPRKRSLFGWGLTLALGLGAIVAMDVALDGKVGFVGHVKRWVRGTSVSVHPTVPSGSPGVNLNDASLHHIDAPIPAPAQPTAIDAGAPGEELSKRSSPGGTAPEPDFAREPQTTVHLDETRIRKAWVETGSIRTHGIRTPIQTPLSDVDFSSCYRMALADGATRTQLAAQNANLSLQFDGAGTSQKVILHGIEWPALVGCIEATVATVHLGRVGVDPSGGTADVNLSFHPP